METQFRKYGFLSHFRKEIHRNLMKSNLEEEIMSGQLSL